MLMSGLDLHTYIRSELHHVKAGNGKLFISLSSDGVAHLHQYPMLLWLTSCMLITDENHHNFPT